MRNSIYNPVPRVSAMKLTARGYRAAGTRVNGGLCEKRILKLLLVTILLLFVSFKSRAQQSDDYALYANIIYRFTKYVNWPADKKSGDFVIGIVGDSPLYDEMKTFTINKHVGSQEIVIKTFSSSSSSYDCQILFISEDASRSLKKIAALTERSSILLVSQSMGLAQKGSCINLVIVDQHLKLEINKSNIQQRNLEVASEFLALGIIVK